MSQETPLRPKRLGPIGGPKPISPLLDSLSPSGSRLFQPSPLANPCLIEPDKDPLEVALSKDQGSTDFTERQSPFQRTPSGRGLLRPQGSQYPNAPKVSPPSSPRNTSEKERLASPLSVVATVKKARSPAKYRRSGSPAWNGSLGGSLDLTEVAPDAIPPTKSHLLDIYHNPLVPTEKDEEEIQKISDRYSDLVSDKVIKTTRAKGEKSDKRQQGSSRVNHVDVLRQRAALYSSPKLRAAIKDLWKHLPGRSGDYVSERGYKWYYRRLYRETVPAGSKEEQEELAEVEWLQESHGQGAMDFNGFYAAMYNFVDIWSEGVDEEGYVSFLQRVCKPLLENITVDETFAITGEFEPEKMRGNQAEPLTADSALVAYGKLLLSAESRAIQGMDQQLSNQALYRAACVELQIEPDSKIMKVLSPEPNNFEMIDINLNAMGLHTIRPLLDVILANKHLKTLLVKKNHLPPFEIGLLCEALAMHPTIEIIDLSSNMKVGNGVASIIHRMLCRNPGITTLRVNNMLPTPLKDKIIHRVEMNMHAKVISLEEFTELKRAFQAMDHHGTGKIGYHELIQYFLIPTSGDDLIDDLDNLREASGPQVLNGAERRASVPKQPGSIRVVTKAHSMKHTARKHALSPSNKGSPGRITSPRGINSPGRMKSPGRMHSPRSMGSSIRMVCRVSADHMGSVGGSVSGSVGSPRNSTGSPHNSVGSSKGSSPPHISPFRGSPVRNRHEIQDVFKHMAEYRMGEDVPAPPRIPSRPNIVAKEDKDMKAKSDSIVVHNASSVISATDLPDTEGDPSEEIHFDNKEKPTEFHFHRGQPPTSDSTLEGSKDDCIGASDISQLLLAPDVLGHWLEGPDEDDVSSCTHDSRHEEHHDQDGQKHTKVKSKSKQRLRSTSVINNGRGIFKALEMKSTNMRLAEKAAHRLLRAVDCNEEAQDLTFLKFLRFHYMDISLDVMDLLIQKLENQLNPNSRLQLTLAKIKQIYEKYDADGSNGLTISELKAGLEEEGLDHQLVLYEKGFRKCDLDGDEELTFTEFMMLMNLVDPCYASTSKH